MNSPKIDLLIACYEYCKYQEEMLYTLGKNLEISPKDIFFTWAYRKCRQSGTFKDNWSYFFHGLDCDLKNIADGRFIKLEFGPYGKVGYFTIRGVLQFVINSCFPWPNFSNFKKKMGIDISILVDKFLIQWYELLEEGIFTVADPSLLMLEEQFTTIDENGLRKVEFPKEIPEDMQISCSVAHRIKISESGFKVLKKEYLESEYNQILL